MTTVTATMMLPSHAQVSLPDVASTPLVLLRGDNTTPFFLHRSPIFHARGSASLSQLVNMKSSVPPSRTPSPLGTGSASVSTSPRVRMSSDQPPFIRPTYDTPPAIIVTTFNQRPPSPPYFSRVHPSPTTPRPISKALPPIPFPSGLPTHTPEDPTIAHAESGSRTPRVSRTPAPRPFSQHSEACLRELEEIAASLKQMSSQSTRTPAGGQSMRERCLPTPPIRITDAKASNLDSILPLDPGLGAPFIVVMDALGGMSHSTEPLPGVAGVGLEGEILRLVEADGGKTPELEGQADMEDLDWVSNYGAWGTSDKGKWKAVVVEATEDIMQAEDAESRPMLRADASEKSYIYEIVGAPEFLAGSSSSRNARVATGYISRPLSKRRTTSRSNTPRPRRRRPAPLVLATPEQADWDQDMMLVNALLFGGRSSRRPQTAPQPHCPPPTARVSKHPQYSQSTDASVLPTADSKSEDDSIPVVDNIPVVPRTPPRTPQPNAVRVLLRDRVEHEQGRQTSWASSSTSGASGTSSEPNSPRPGGRVRLKSLKSLFRHFSK